MSTRSRAADAAQMVMATSAPPQITRSYPSSMTHQQLDDFLGAMGRVLDRNVQVKSPPSTSGILVLLTKAAQPALQDEVSVCCGCLGVGDLQYTHAHGEGDANLFFALHL